MNVMNVMNVVNVCKSTTFIPKAHETNGSLNVMKSASPASAAFAVAGVNVRCREVFWLSRTSLANVSERRTMQLWGYPQLPSGISPESSGISFWGSPTRSWDSVGDIPAQITRCWDHRVFTMGGRQILKSQGALEISPRFNLGEISRDFPRSLEIFRASIA